MKNVWIGLFVLMSMSVAAQYDHESVFSDLDGDELRDALIDNYKTSKVLSYSQARDTFFRNIDAVDNVLECVYTGFKINLDPNSDPTEDAFSKGINTEHTYPRSKGALEGTKGYSDMHHLFPSRERVNTDRSNLIFREIVDSQTDKWYFEENITNSVPTQGIDNYSELLTNEGFEPREKHKGDVARAYFYFYTMYQSTADQADPNYFSLQRETMCQWHFDDPVDQKEWERNNKIAVYQDGKKNPFILDCKLARLYCEDILGSCISVSTIDNEQSSIHVKPNPTRELMFVEVDNSIADNYTIHSLDGTLISNGFLAKEGKSTSVSTDILNNGFYIITVYSNTGKTMGVVKFVKI